MLAFNKSLKSETSKSIFHSLFFSHGVYPISDIDFKLFLSSVFPATCKGGPWLSLFQSIVRAICVQFFIFWSKCYLPPELAVQEDHYTDQHLGFTLHCPLMRFQTHCVFTHLCFYSCDFLTMERDLQTFISTIHFSKSLSIFRHQL